MNTCKATLRVLFAHRVYLMIYLVFIGILMMSISWAMLTSASGSMSAVFESTKTRVAIIDRDSDRGDIATSMRAYLRDSSELVDLDDTSETLQQAVASNWVDLIVIIPDGFADDYVAAAADGDNPPNVDTVTSYASGSGIDGADERRRVPLAHPHRTDRRADEGRPGGARRHDERYRRGRRF